MQAQPSQRVFSKVLPEFKQPVMLRAKPEASPDQPTVRVVRFFACAPLRLRMTCFGNTLSDMSLIDRIRLVRAELADDVVISAVFAMLITETWRHIMITTRWLENLVNRNISNYEEKIRAEGLTEGRTEGREGRAEMLTQVLDLLDEDTRKDVERKLEPNGDSDTQD